MPRPSPFLLHAWLQAWWSHSAEDASVAVYVAYRDGTMVGALPLCVQPRLGLRVLTFPGSPHSALADLLVAEGEDESVGASLVERAASSSHDFADLYGLPSGSRLVEALGPTQLRLVKRSEAPVLDMRGGWDAVYRAKLSSKRRNFHGRRRRQLAKAGRVEASVARTEEELASALEDAFVVHERRWAGRPDGSGFTTPAGMRFHRDAIRALAKVGVPRIVTLKLDGEPIAFHYYFLLEGRMYVHRIAFDPDFARFSPGLINTLDAIEAAADEGATVVEFLGGAERYKLELADRLDPLYQAFGLARTIQGRAAVAGRVGGIRLRRGLKRSSTLRRFYFDGLAPARRALGRVTGRS
jgi:CelD/BcsL family acetyltransferase involved in cellulose biosynthesis